MRYLTMCSGIECASLAAKPLGWEPICFSEIEPFPSAVLAHRYPDVPNVGDMTLHDWSQYRGRCDAVIAGTPCQAFSVAGRRESLADARGNLTLSFVEAVNAIDPAFVVWENVPGVLSTRDNAFGCFLAALAGHDSPLDTPDGERWTDSGVVIGTRRSLAWRILDAQYFGVPQRRRRVFLVGCPRSSGIDPSEILFEREGMRGDSPQGGKAGKDIAPSVTGGAPFSGTGNARVECEALIVGAVSAKWAKGTGGPAGDECQNLLITGTLTARGDDGMRLGNSFDLQGGLQVAHTLTRRYDSSEDGCGRGTPPVTAFHGSQDPAVSGGVTHPVGRNQGLETCVAFTQNQCGALGTNQNATGRNTAKVMATGVRRMTPRECERLQGLPSVVELNGEIMTKDEMIISALAAGFLRVDLVTGEVFRMRGPGGVVLPSPKKCETTHPSGYRTVHFQIGDRKKNIRLHRIVWVSANGPVPDGKVIDHINSDKNDNRIENLQLLTPQENSTKAARDGRYHFEKTTKLDVDMRKALFWDYAAGGGSYSDMAEKYGITKGRVGKIIREHDYTLIPWRGGMAPDGPRYKAIGNGMAVPCVRWILERIEEARK